MILHVTWRDAYFDFDSDGKHRSDYLVSTVGHLVSATGPFLTIASERLPDDDGWRAVTHIPRECIADVGVLARIEVLRVEDL